ncbi:uncharacterized protein LOC101459879 [Ceratitis capitata]|uniref:uncharacterized protein LOC101459879 n=1 Tax=Ceratitis capitata TaxID=7213 RepID=UPI00032A07CF|nr:uncharacterized protein LOC101459879 [Ceratitis capitata]
MTEEVAPGEAKSSKINPSSDTDANVPYSQREFELLYKEICLDRKKKEDWRDDSRHPSYTNFVVPYHFKCRDRYHNTKKEYEEQFQHEINQLMNNLNTAYEVARFNRHLCITSLWPPLHNRAELLHTQRYYFRLKPKEHQRLNQIFNTKIH